MSSLAESGLFDEDPEYQAFLEKFKPKKTTDDCYTPENIYRVILEWAAAEYGFSPEKAVRPFWPGADFERFDYPADCIVVDNPPFSICARICDVYLRHGVQFLIFCPGLSSLGTAATRRNLTLLQTEAAITYENGARVNTAFLTNLDDPDVVIRSAPELSRRIEAADRENVAGSKKQLRKLAYPDSVITGARVKYFCAHGVEYAVRRSESGFIRKLDNDANGSGIFGGGLLLSEAATEARRAAEKRAIVNAEAELREQEMAAIEREEARNSAVRHLELSERERELQRRLK